jgi:2-polyprenyl-6-methoxyphenol hydroxylase-like FAD-dependent oxidoreductase
VRADVVVDGSGVATHADAWLAELGCRPPDVEVTPVHRWYVTMPVQRPPAYDGDPTFWLCFPKPPATAACLMSPLDRMTWLVSASGSDRDVVPADSDGLRNHATAVGADELSAALAGAVLCGKPTLFRRPSVRWRRYDKPTELPEGFLPVGDAVAALNPLLGQGMSVAAWQASLLADGLPDSAADHHRRVAEAVSAALDLTALEERSVQDGTGRTYPAAEYLPALALAAREDAELHARYVRMWHLLTPVDDLLQPSAVDRVLDPRAPRNGGTLCL